MRIARPPLLLLPAVAIAVAVFITLLATALIGEAHMRGAYQVWQENETFAAACIALLAAMFAARPVYLQVQAQSVQAALDLLRRRKPRRKL
jgi:type III secretory pathway component EscR